ncbi:MAG: enoyl-CoA hydratase-related protein [Gaiellales bacterium]
MGTVSSTRDGGVLRIRLERPDRRNAFDATMISELTAAFGDVGDARAVLLSGDGPSFCAGADLDWMRASVELDETGNLADAQRLAALFAAVDGCPAPVVAAVHGHAIAGGAGLVACSDIAVAEPGTRFAFTETRIGLIPATISPYVIDRIGATAARRYLLTAEQFEAVEAQRIGLIAAIVDDPLAEAEAIAGTLCTLAPDAVRATKRLIRERPPQDELAARIAAARVSPEGQAGLRALLAGEDPPWRSAPS